MRKISLKLTLTGTIRFHKIVTIQKKKTNSSQEKKNQKKPHLTPTSKSTRKEKTKENREENKFKDERDSHENIFQVWNTWF